MPKIEGELFVWSCSCGRQSNADISKLVAVANDESVDARVITCSNSGCDQVFELSDEFVSALRKASKESD